MSRGGRFCLVCSLGAPPCNFRSGAPWGWFLQHLCGSRTARSDVRLTSSLLLHPDGCRLFSLIQLSLLLDLLCSLLVVHSPHALSLHLGGSAPPRCCPFLGSSSSHPPPFWFSGLSPTHPATLSHNKVTLKYFLSTCVYDLATGRVRLESRRHSSCPAGAGDMVRVTPGSAITAERRPGQDTVAPGEGAVNTVLRGSAE